MPANLARDRPAVRQDAVAGARTQRVPTAALLTARSAGAAIASGDAELAQLTGDVTDVDFRSRAAEETEEDWEDRGEVTVQRTLRG